MCGRIALFTPPERVAHYLGARPAPGLPAAEGEGWAPRWNVGPTSTILGVRDGDGTRVLDRFRWGLVPPATTEAQARQRFRSTFNARDDRLTTNSLWRGPFATRRLLVPVSAFYEWRALAPGEKRKQPYRFDRPNGEPLVLAGLWQRWPAGEDVRCSATIVTTSAGPDMPIHDRQPVVLEPGQWERWLQPDAEAEELLAMVRPGAGQLTARPVSKDAGTWGTDGAFTADVVFTADGVRAP